MDIDTSNKHNGVIMPRFIRDNGQKCAFLPYSEFLLLSKLWPINMELFEEWLHGFICKPNKNLNRQGAVCPHAIKSIRHDRLFLSYINLDTVDKSKRQQVTMNCLVDISKEFKASSSNEEFSLDCLIVTVSGIEDHELDSVIGHSQKAIKPIVLGQKLMIGGCHPHNYKPSRRNPKLLPMIAPLPLFVFRHMVERDFLPLEDNEEYFAIYRQFYPDIRKITDT